jgi:tetratricopeptide (TPR) repeat protein
MKQLRMLFIALFLFVASGVYAQGTSVTSMQKWIKAGNSLREAHQYEQGESYLTKGLDAAKAANNLYWQAVADEYLGLLYANTNELPTATQYFNEALRLYKSQNLGISAKVVKDIMGEYNIATDEPIKYYAGIEIGARGVKYSVLKIVRKGGQLAFASVQDGSQNTDIINFTPDAIQQTCDAVNTFIKTVSQYNGGIPNDNIFVAISSGVKQEADRVPGREDQLKQALLKAVPTYNKPINFLSACQEGELTIKGVVPSAFVYSSSLVDIGSGNTKGGYKVRGEKDARCLSIPWGTATFARKIAGRENINEYAAKFFQDSIQALISNAIDNSGFTNRQIAYYSGGIFWAMCNYLHPEKIGDNFTEFNSGDVELFLNEALSNYDVLINPDLTRITDPAALAEAKKQVANSQKTFNRENIIAGGYLLKGIIDEMQRVGTRNKHFYFSRYGYVGWISGYVAIQIDNEFKLPE